MWQDIAAALSLVLVLEGILPFLSPRHWRSVIIEVVQQSDRSIRLIGLFSMLAGVLLLSWVR